MDTNLYWALRGSYVERKAILASWSVERLQASILDGEYNDFMRSRSDYADGDKQERPSGKRLPYIGWYWRHLPFSSGTLPIGDCGEFIGFMANNKWDYPERNMTPAEFSATMEIVDEAMRLDQQGGDLREIVARTRAKLDELWPLLQSMTI